MTALGRARELAALVDEFAPPAWRRDPAWWALLAAAAVAEPRGRRGPAPYLISDARPDADTYMAAIVAPLRDPSAWVAWAVAAAHAAVDAVARLDGTLPDQPLAVAIARVDGHAVVRPLAQPRRVGFAIGDRVLSGLLDRRGPAYDGDLARALARALAGEPSQLVADGPPPQVVIALGDDATAWLRHGHRRAWRDGGGPWLGVARAGELLAVSTCHLVVDGYGHALLTEAIADAAVPAALHVPVVAALPPLVAVRGEALDVAWAAAPACGAIAGAYALGRVLHRRGDPRALRSPPLQLPVAPGARDDDTRRGRRVRPALLSVRFPDSRPEPLAVFATRARAAIAREAAGAGLATRLLTGLTGVPMPLALKRRALAAGPSRLLRGPEQHLAGDACLSLLRHTGAAPLVAVSAPPPQIPRSRGSAVVTIIHAATGSLTTVATTGPWSARALLDDWHAELARVATLPR